MSAQILDNIIFEGENMGISSNDMTTNVPLPNLPIEEGLVEKVAKAPHSSTSNENKDLRQIAREMREYQYLSSACRRGYIGSWEIKDNKLYLLDIKGSFKINAPTPLFADWFSGEILVVSGEIIKYIHLGFLRKYEFEREINIENGIVKNIKFIDNRQRAKDEGWKLRRGLINYIEED